MIITTKDSLFHVQLALYVSVGGLFVRAPYVLTHSVHNLLVAHRTVKAKVVVTFLSPFLIGDDFVIIASCLIAGLYSLLRFDPAVSVNFHNVIYSIFVGCIQKHLYHVASISQNVVSGSSDDDE